MLRWAFLASFVIVVCATPVTLVWGWVRWAKRPQFRTPAAVLSLAGFALATTSGLVAVAGVLYAHAFGGLAFNDPLPTMFSWGLGLGLIGLLLAFCGVWESSPLRWHAIAGSLGMLLFWSIALSGE